MEMEQTHEFLAEEFYDASVSQSSSQQQCDSTSHAIEAPTGVAGPLEPPPRPTVAKSSAGDHRRAWPTGSSAVRGTVLVR